MSNKLTCTTHRRRVLVIESAKDGKPIIVHRNGDHTRCDSYKVTIFDKVYTPTDIIQKNNHWK